MIVDAFSRLTGDHPATLRWGALADAYVVAPAEDDTDIETFPDRAGTCAAAAGGLLPVLDLDSGALGAALGEPFWCGLLLGKGGHGRTLDDPALEDLLAARGAAAMPIVVDCGRDAFSRPADLTRFLERAPERPIVLTHGAQLNISGGHLEAAAEIFAAHPWTVLESSGIYRQDFLEQMLEAIGAERIVYGSGHPLMHEALEVERIRLLPCATHERAAMLGGNAARLFGLQKPM